MKRIRLLLPLLFAAGQLYAQGVKFSTDKPAAGSTIQFTYQPEGTNLEKLTDITCTAYTFYSTTTPKSTKIDLIKQGDLYKGEFSTTDSVTLVGLSFAAGEQKDEAPAGYILKFTKNGKIPAESFLNEGFLYGLAGNYYLGLTIDAEAAAALYNQAFTIRPALKEKNTYTYLSLAYKADKEKGAKLIQENLNNLSKVKNASEDQLILQFNLYSLLKEKEKAEAVKVALLKKFPVGNFAYGQDMNALYAEKDLALKEQKATDLLAKFKLDPQKKADAAKQNNLNNILASAFLKAGNYSKFEFYAAKIDNKLNRASLYNSFAWESAEKNKHIELATKLSKESLDLLNAAKNDETPAFYATKEAYLKSVNSSYGMYADTYALLLYRQGNFKEALKVQEQALPLYTVVSPDVAARYVTYLIKDGQHEKAFGEAEKIIKDGQATDSLKTDFKNLYVSLKKEGTYEGYLANLERIALEKDRAIWSAKMINLPAPAFSLVNLKGETVSLASLKGKIVVLDYWATWCGPCVASFPGMQKAIAKYSNNPKVAFVFINTWQTEDNREKLVTDFIAEKKYDFNVLYDTKNKQDPSKFDVVDAYKVDGIPTKFIIDGDGNIRFKAVGFSGSDDGVVKELDSMIGLLTAKN